MLARLRKTRDENEGGFTLIELLVVMIIIGILAAIAIPVFLSQRAKAQDSAAKADVSTIGKEIATYYVDGTGAGTVAIAAATTGATATADAITSGHYTLLAGGFTRDLGKASANNALGATTAVTSETVWCMSITNAKGDKAKVGYKYSAAGGLAEGVCP